MKITKGNRIGYIIAKSGSKSSIKQEMLNVIDKHFYQSFNWTHFLPHRDVRLIADYTQLIDSQGEFMTSECWYKEKFNISDKIWNQTLTKESLEKHLHNLMGSNIDTDPENPKRIKEFTEKIIVHYPKITLKQIVKIYKDFLELGGIFTDKLDEKIAKIETFLN